MTVNKMISLDPEETTANHCKTAKNNKTKKPPASSMFSRKLCGAALEDMLFKKILKLLYNEILV